MKTRLGILLLLILATVAPLMAQTKPAAPLTEKEVIDLLKGSTAPNRVGALVTERGVSFELTPDIEKKLRKAKADDQLIDLIRNEGPAARAYRGKSGQAAPGPQITREESDAFGVIRSELDPDRAITLVDDFEKKFPKSPLLSYVYFFAASAYQQKSDAEKTVEYCDKSLKLNPENLMSLVLISSMVPQPQYLNNHKMDREKRLADAENYSTHALQLITQLPRQGNETGEQFEKRRAGFASVVHGSLGLIHLERSSLTITGQPDREELAKAEAEYKTAVTGIDRPDPRDYYRLGETYSMDGKLDEAIEAFTKASELGQGTAIKTFADQRLEDLKNRKARTTPPPKP
jgi:tetratricopeptide (TPR) repeat protein